MTSAAYSRSAPVLNRGDKVVLTAFGTHGDVAPFVQVGRHLAAQGMRVTVATSDYYRSLVESRGLTFVEGAPSEAQLLSDLGMNVPALMQAATHKLSGARFAARNVVMPYLARNHAQLLDACQDAKALVSHVYSFAAPLVAEQLPHLAWRSLCLQPMALMLPADAPLLSEFLPIHRLAPLLGVQRYGRLLELLKSTTRPWMAEVDKLRQELGLPPSSKHPLFEGAYSQEGTFGLFDSVLMPRQEGLPANWHWAGFCHDDGTVPQADPGLEEFLRAGPPPVVFTLGSSAVHYSRRFYEEAAKAALSLRLRAVLLTGGHPCAVKAPGIYETPWASHAALFPRAQAVVHQGGMGTLSQALRAGVPQVVVPFGNDQPDNAERLRKLGVASVVRSWRIGQSQLATALRKVLSDPEVLRQTFTLAQQVNRTCGAWTVARQLTEVG